MEKKVELLAPAGNIQCFKAAVSAGADAVYLGGDKFGARAYADNFSKEELLWAIDYGHLFNKKIYLTLNTLLKNEELTQVADYLKPFYEAGLDGVIIQDFGVLSFVKEHFPELELHASTQMTVTGKEGAALLKEYGVCRIVPARELSLEEIREIKQQVDIEIETFIHGAMCYAYSGQCLFSSMLGGRSGNRGRCAGPCRLPYDAFLQGKQINEKKEQYLLSLKDMCSISLLPKLINAGIDSFKIEGRMKSAEYVAGVTSIYRKYIDRFYHKKQKEIEDFQIEKKDLELLKKLYVRSDLETGYYEKHHGASMVTLQKPCYETGNKEELKCATEAYLSDDLKIPVRGRICLREGQRAELSFETEGKMGTVSVIIKGNEVQTASNRPVEEETVKKQIAKMGGTVFELTDLDIVLEGRCFISVKELNDLRRQALEEIRNELTKTHRRIYGDVLKKQDSKLNDTGRDTYPVKKEAYHIGVANAGQLKAVMEFFQMKEQEGKKLPITRILLSSDLFYKNQDILTELSYLKEHKVEISMFFPKIVRRKTLGQLKEMVLKKPEMSYVSSFTVGNLELLSFFKKHYPNVNIYGDYSLYSFNNQSYDFLTAQGMKEMCMPYEWSRHEMKAFQKEHPNSLAECIVYGYIPLMESAGCILKTTGRCGNSLEKGEAFPVQKKLYLQDRYKKKLPVFTHCDRCENTIYNSVPYSLHKELGTLKEMGIFKWRMDFTIETKEETVKVLQYFINKENRQQPFMEFTKGHFKKGIE